MSAASQIPIVGVGASAGGIEAFKSFFERLPVDTGMAFVIVTHLSPDRQSALPEILGRYTTMPVASATKNALLKPNHVYVCPPGRFLTVKGGKLRLTPVIPELHRFPIDKFLISLAQDLQEGAIGILLSGGGSDGTLGLRAIREAGGVTLAQGHDGSRPSQSSMPDTAVAAGVVDLVLPVEEMGRRLAEFARTRRTSAARTTTEQDVSNNVVTDRALARISDILLNRLGHDFSGYKPNTFLRRVQRRMQVLRVNTIESYITRLRDSPDEARLLFRDLLIGVTSFFRDPAAFKALQEQVIPALFEHRGANSAIRVWVPGCATGEEAYSIAILLREQMDRVQAVPTVQIFATDIDEGALEIARVGRYPRPALANVSKDRLERFFSSEDASHTVSKDIREMCVFSPHNVLRDPSFSRLDLISCRNVLIYFGAEFQARVLPLLHFALKPGGVLFLGTSENVSQHPDLFVAVDKKNHLYRRRDGIIMPLNLPRNVVAGMSANIPLAREEPRAELSSLRNAVEARVMQEFAPAHVLVNREGDVLFYSARTGKYLEAAPGLPSRQLLSMARRGLRLELGAALREAVERRKKVEQQNLVYEIDGRAQAVDLVIEPFGQSDHDPLFLVVFRDGGQLAADTAATKTDTGSEERVIAQVERELNESRERLQLTVEEYETAVEELKSSNEELQSVNEELQSTNEEMETSKEELQSVNEELNTVNAELSDKVEELDRANDDLRNIFETTGVAIVFLDRNLVIRTFTPPATAIFKLIASDRGRPLTDLVSNLTEPQDLKRDIRAAFTKGRTIERRVTHVDGHTSYVMRVIPYRNDKGKTEGVLVVFVDVSNLIAHETRQRALIEELNSRVSTVLNAVVQMSQKRRLRTGRPSNSVGHFWAACAQWQPAIACWNGPNGGMSHFPTLSRAISILTADVT